MERFIIWREDGRKIPVEVLLEKMPDVDILSRRPNRLVVRMTPHDAQEICAALPELRMQQDQRYTLLKH